MHFMFFLCILGVFRGGGGIGDSGGKIPPQEIAGNNTDNYEFVIIFAKQKTQRLKLIL